MTPEEKATQAKKEQEAADREAAFEELLAKRRQTSVSPEKPKEFHIKSEFPLETQGDEIKQE